jgi:hypothetical protein
MAVAARWPLYEVLLSPTWQDAAQLTSVWVARRAPDSEKAAVAYLLVDLACLGVKSAQVKRFSTMADYNEFRVKSMRVQPMAPADLDLVAKVVYTALNYAWDLGFKPDFVFNQAEALLAGADPTRCATQVPVGGPEGKPFFINGPYDDVDRIIATLRRTVGDGNFNYMIQAGPNGLLDEDDFD